MSLMIVGSCRKRRKGTVLTNLKINVMVVVRLLLLLLKVQMVNAWLFLLTVFLVMMNGYLILLLRFIFVVTNIGSVFMSLCRVEILCV